MTATVFDTLAAARELEDAGVEREHAAAIASIARRASAADRETLATKADLAALEARLANRLLGAVLAIVAANAALLAVAIAILKFL